RDVLDRMDDRDTPGLRRVLELHVASFLSDLVPTVGPESRDDRPAIYVHKYTFKLEVSTNTHYGIDGIEIFVRPVLALISLDKRHKHVETIALGRAFRGTPQPLDLGQCFLVPSLVSDRCNRVDHLVTVGCYVALRLEYSTRSDTIPARRSSRRGASARTFAAACDLPKGRHFGRGGEHCAIRRHGLVQIDLARHPLDFLPVAAECLDALFLRLPIGAEVIVERFAAYGTEHAFAFCFAREDHGIAIKIIAGRGIGKAKVKTRDQAPCRAENVERLVPHLRREHAKSAREELLPFWPAVKCFAPCLAKIARPARCERGKKGLRLRNILVDLGGIRASPLRDDQL